MEFENEEIWKRIPGFSEYQVSSHGRIRSIERTKRYKSGRTMSLKAKIRKLRIHSVNGFLMTDLINDKNKRKTVYVHKAIAEAFIYNATPRKRKVVIHKDGDLANNSLENLEWASYSESIKKGFDAGTRDNSNLWKKRRAKYGPSGATKPQGRKNPLSEEQKAEILELRAKKGITLEKLAKRYNCSISHIHKTLKSGKLLKK